MLRTKLYNELSIPNNAEALSVSSLALQPQAIQPNQLLRRPHASLIPRKTARSDSERARFNPENVQVS